jgi:type II secretory pathway component PulF
MIKSYNLANFTRTLGLLLRSGVDVQDAISMSADTSGNLAYKYAFKRIGEAVVKGESMSREIGRERWLFGDMLPSMVAIGESTGNLSGMLIYLSELYESEVEEATKNLSSAIEPALMVLMGLLVGFIAVSIITPIYEITNNLHG